MDYSRLSLHCCAFQPFFFFFFLSYAVIVDFDTKLIAHLSNLSTLKSTFQRLKIILTNFSVPFTQTFQLRDLQISFFNNFFIKNGSHDTIHTFKKRDLQISFFNNFFIKNGSHDTIHTFKNYFTTVFSVFSF